MIAFLIFFLLAAALLAVIGLAIQTSRIELYRRSERQQRKAAETWEREAMTFRDERDKARAERNTEISVSVSRTMFLQDRIAKLHKKLEQAQAKSERCHEIVHQAVERRPQHGKPCSLCHYDPVALREVPK